MDFQSELNSYLGTIQLLRKKNILGNATALHYQLLIEDEKYAAEHVRLGFSFMEQERTYKGQGHYLENAALKRNPYSMFGYSMAKYPYKIQAIIELYFIREMFALGRPSTDVIGDIHQSIIDFGKNHHIDWDGFDIVFNNPLSLRLETIKNASKTLCMDRYQLESDLTGLLRKTTLSDNTPAKMMIPSNRVTLIEYPRDNGMTVFNEDTGFHDLDSILIVRDDYENNGALNKFMPEDLVNVANIQPGSEYTVLTFLMLGAPRLNANIVDDAALFFQFCFSSEDQRLENIFCQMERATQIATQIGQLKFSDDEQKERYFASVKDIVKTATATLLFKNSNYHRIDRVDERGRMEKESVQSTQQINRDKFLRKYMKISDANSVSYLRYKSTSNEEAQGIKNYLKDNPSGQRASPEEHWRGPHIKSQAYGPKWQNHRVIFIPPVLVNEKNITDVNRGRTFKLKQ